MGALFDHAAAAELAEGAGALLLDVRASGVSGDKLKRLGVQASNELWLSELRSRFPDNGNLSEKSEDDGTRLLHEQLPAAHHKDR
jgi:3'(2'), 5'-bisphosphate nucleotidase